MMQELGFLKIEKPGKKKAAFSTPSQKPWNLRYRFIRGSLCAYSERIPSPRKGVAGTGNWLSKYMESKSF